MGLNGWIRRFHRWMSITFTAGVATYMVVMTQGRPQPWVGLLALVPLILLLITGLYLFVLPHVARVRGAREA